MKPFLSAVIIGSFLFSCNGPNNASKEITSFVDTVDMSKGVHHADSLDLDTSPLITTNFPDTVSKVLHNDIDTLWGYIDSSFAQVNKQEKQFSKTKLNHLLINSGFIVDTSETEKFARKKDFNKRYAVKWLAGKSDTITTQVQYWYNGRTYILVNMRWNLLD